MKQEKIGKFIAQLRKEQNISQEELAKKLCISRQAISKWEVGKILPDAFNLQKLSEIFNVDVNELLTGEHITKTESEAITNYYFHIYNVKNKKKKIIIYLLLSLLLLLLVISSIFFTNNYGKTKVYQISGETENFFTSDGLFVITSGKSYFKMDLETTDEIRDSIEKMKLYYTGTGGYIYTIFFCENCKELNITLYDFNGYNVHFDMRDLENILKNTKLEITYNGKTEIIDLEFKEDYINNKFFYPKVETISSVPVINDYEQEENDNKLIEGLKPKLIKSYDGYVLEKKMSSHDIFVAILDGSIYLEIIKDGQLSEYYSYLEENDVLLYEKYDDEKKILSLLMDIRTDTCTKAIGKCGNVKEIFNNFVSILNEI